MAEAVLGPLVGRLQELATSEARALVAVNDDIRSLRDKLMWMQAFLRDAEPRRRAKNDEPIRVCLQQTRDAVFEAEDAVDQYFFRIDLSRDDFVLPLVGRYAQLEDLGRALISEQTEHPMVITVIGKSGVGKTKLVKERYERHSTKRYFDVKAWVTCAPNLGASHLMKLILLRLIEGPVRCSNDDDLRKMLQKVLERKKYLLVIDAEVSSMEWNLMLGYLPTENANSRVVRITQATDLEPPPSNFREKNFEIHHFEEQDIIVELFLATLFMNNKEKHSGDLVTKAVKTYHAKFIFDVTGGLPLAVVLLSGLLRTKEYPGEWGKVFKHLEGNSNERKRLDNILSMCFDDLPHDLKCCFLYFAGFPASTLVKARSLVCMWMAEGFLRPKEGKTMEKVGERYLHELIHRRLMNLPPVENAAPGDERVTVQTRVHDFLVLEAQEANFMEIHSGDDVPTLSTARRLSLQNHMDKYVAIADPLPKLRSIISNFEKEESQGSVETKKAINTDVGACIPFHRKAQTCSNDVMQKLLQGSKFLRVIFLDGLEIGNKLPSEISNVKHLHYLRITSCSINEIPSSVGNLTRLQTLDVRNTSITKLPREFSRIPMLRHVFGSVILPMRVGKLEQLQTLQAVKHGDGVGVWDIATFAYMKRLQSLYIEDLPDKNAHASLAAIYEVKYLVVLSIQGNVISMDLYTFSNFMRLQVMILNGKIEPQLKEGNPLCFSKFPTLTRLSLKNTKVSQHFIKKLSELPLLASLALLTESYEERCLAFTQGFQSLKELKLDLDMGVKEIIIVDPTCPCLQKLEISNCSEGIHLKVQHNIEKIIEHQDQYLYNKMKNMKVHDVDVVFHEDQSSY